MFNLITNVLVNFDINEDNYCLIGVITDHSNLGYVDMSESNVPV